MSKLEAGPCFCPAFHQAVELIGRKWTGAIIRAMLYGRIRFSEIQAAIPGLSDRMLSERLQELEQHGVVRRLVIPETPVRIEYHLTDKGKSLASVLKTIAAWAMTWDGTPPGAGGNEPAPEAEPAGLP